MSGHPPLVMGIQQGSAVTEETPNPALIEEAETCGNNQQILFENHGIDARYTGPHEVAPTMSARYGTGGNNVPLVSDMPESYCIAGNIIDREVQNGGNGLGCQPDIPILLRAQTVMQCSAAREVMNFCKSGNSDSERQTA